MILFVCKHWLEYNKILLLYIYTFFFLSYFVRKNISVLDEFLKTYFIISNNYIYFLLVPSLCLSTDVSIDEQQVIYYPPSTDISMSITTEHSEAIDVNIISHNNLQSKKENDMKLFVF